MSTYQAMGEGGGNNVAICLQGNGIDRADTAGCNGKGWRDDDVSFTLNTIDRPAVLYQPRSAMEENWEEGDVKNALRAGESKSSHALVECYDARGNGDGETCPTITGDHENRITDYTAVCCTSAVRRLTPLECERLQGYPDGWTDIGEWVDSKGKRHQTADSARYKALGNSIALPYWRYLLKRISAQFEYTPTMASLFDGIGGFPYLWEGINGKGTCLWASEIEEFPMAVTKLRIGEHT